MKKILVIDTRLVAFETYHTRTQITDSLSIIVDNAKLFSNKYDKIVFAVDNIYGSKRRKELYPEYKAHRKEQYKTKAEKNRIKQFNSQYTKFVDILKYFGYVINIDGYEADDIANIIVDTFCNEYQVVLLSSDSDWASNIINDNVFQIHIKRQQVIRRNDVEKQFGVIADVILPLQALIGVNKENIKGIYKLGKTIAIKLFKDFNYDISKVIAEVQTFIDNSKYGMYIPNGFNTVEEMYNFNYNILRRVSINDLNSDEVSLLKKQFASSKVREQKDIIEQEIFFKLGIPYIILKKVENFFRV